MTNQSFEQEITSQLHRLSPDQKKRVLEFVQALAQETERPSGVAGSELLCFAGSIEKDDLMAMEQAIAEGCERVNLNEW
ncbi:MAG: hypothetical protein WCA08_14410 [Desulfoferrobacter sp.]